MLSLSHRLLPAGGIWLKAAGVWGKSSIINHDQSLQAGDFSIEYAKKAEGFPEDFQGESCNARFFVIFGIGGILFFLVKSDNMMIPGTKGRKSDASLLIRGFLPLGPAQNMKCEAIWYYRKQ